MLRHETVRRGFCFIDELEFCITELARTCILVGDVEDGDEILARELGCAALLLETASKGRFSIKDVYEGTTEEVYSFDSSHGLMGSSVLYRVLRCIA